MLNSIEMKAWEGESDLFPDNRKESEGNILITFLNDCTFVG